MKYVIFSDPSPQCHDTPFTVHCPPTCIHKAWPPSTSHRVHQCLCPAFIDSTPLGQTSLALCLLALLSRCLCTRLSVWMSACLHASLPTLIRVFLFACLRFIPPACLRTFLVSLSECLNDCLLYCNANGIANGPSRIFTYLTDIRWCPCKGWCVKRMNTARKLFVNYMADDGFLLNDFLTLRRHIIGQISYICAHININDISDWCPETWVHSDETQSCAGSHLWSAVLQSRSGGMKECDDLPLGAIGVSRSKRDDGSSVRVI